MKFVVITRDAEVEEAAKKGLHPDDEILIFQDWEVALDASAGTDLLFVDLIATLHEPHKIEGYEEFAMAKMRHPVAKDTKLALIGPPPDYDLDFMAGWPDFVFLHYTRPVDYRVFRRASTWV